MSGSMSGSKKNRMTKKYFGRRGERGGRFAVVCPSFVHLLHCDEREAGDRRRRARKRRKTGRHWRQR